MREKKFELRRENLRLENWEWGFDEDKILFDLNTAAMKGAEVIIDQITKDARNPTIWLGDDDRYQIDITLIGDDTLTLSFGLDDLVERSASYYTGGHPEDAETVRRFASHLRQLADKLDGMTAKTERDR